MSLLHRDGCECMLSQLEMFTVPVTQASIEKSQYIKFYPITSLDSAGPIEFCIVTSDTEYLDVSKIFLYTKNRILDGAGKEIPETVETKMGEGFSISTPTRQSSPLMLFIRSGLSR